MDNYIPLPRWYRKNMRPTWVPPQIAKITGALKAATEHLGLDFQSVLDAAKDGKLEKLDKETWERLQNSMSWVTTRISQAKENAKGQNKPWKKILIGFIANSAVAAPTIVWASGHAPYLVSGETRLQVARATKVRPTVWMVKL